MKNLCIWYSVLALGILPPFSAKSSETLPDLVGRHLSEIKAMPALENVALEIQRVDSPTRRDVVLLQIPGVGSDISTDPRVYLKISNGLVVPDILGRSQADAESALHDAGMGSAATQRPHPLVPRDIVAVQIPEAGTRIDASREIVYLVVSDEIEMPNLIGLTTDQALETVKESGLNGHLLPQKFRTTTGDFCRGFIRWNRQVTASDPVSKTFVMLGTEVIIHHKGIVSGQFGGHDYNHPCWGPI